MAPDNSHNQIPDRSSEGSLPPAGISRRCLLGGILGAISMAACDKIRKITGIIDPEHKDDEVATVHKSQQAPPRDANRPEFLDQNKIEFNGLGLLMSNNDQFDRYIFNAVTGNKAFTNIFQIQKDYPFEFDDGRTFEFPYHAFLFKAFDPRSNVNLPSRLGRAKNSQNLAELFNGVTIYKASNPKDIIAIKTILVASYELSFGIRLDPNLIEIIPDSEGKIQTIKYKAANARDVFIKTIIAAKAEADSTDPESKNISELDNQKFALVNSNGDLQFPPSVMTDQGIGIPPSALPNYTEIAYEQHFRSQGKDIRINISIPFGSILKEQDALHQQNRSRDFNFQDGLKTRNPAWYILDNDPFVKKIADIITEKFHSKKEKMQAILDFAHSYNYVPDAYGDAPRTPLISLICKGGDCEDSSILTVALARAVGIDCVFTYFDGHQGVACDIGGSGTAFEFEDKKYEWIETTGGREGVVQLTHYQNEEGKIVKTVRKARGFKIGERSQNVGVLQCISRIDSKELIFLPKKP